MNEIQQSTTIPKVGLYTGEIGSYLRRGIIQCESIWNAEVQDGLGPYALDVLLTTSINTAIEQGQDQVTVFDFGCGTGNLFSDFLSHQNACTNTKALLRENPSITVRFIGITDSPGIPELEDTPPSLFTELPMTNPDASLTNVSASRYIYPVTAAQPLDIFFQTQDVTSIDLALATQSLPYLSTRNFYRVMHTIVNRLNIHGGRFIAAPYATQVPGFVRGAIGYELNIKSRREGLKPSNLNVHALWHRLNDVDGNVDIPKEIEILQAALNKYISLGVVTPLDVHNHLTVLLKKRTRWANMLKKQDPQLEQLMSYNEKTSDALFKMSSLLYTSNSKLFARGIKKIRQDKELILTYMQKGDIEHTKVRFGKHIIDISKAV